MAKDKIQIMKLGEKERRLLLVALDLDFNNLICDKCGEKINYKNCAIMPHFGNANATLLCNSILCMTEYFEDVEEAGREIN